MTAEATVTLSELDARVGQTLANNSPADHAQRYDETLKTIAGAFQAVTATLHRADTGTQSLHMVAQLGLPEPLIAITRQIPFGKGIAGQCAQQREPITLCNLQTDTSGAARPNAKQTGVAGAISVPVFAPDGALIGTLGVGKLEAHTYTPAEQQVLERVAARIGHALKSDSTSA
jgi:signal transduction protein with GAF and PtsI domain